MTGAHELRGMQLPKPDLSEAYRDLPKPWQVGAVLLADRILAAAYQEDVRSCAMAIAADLEAGAVRGMTLPEDLEEACDGHPRVVDRRRALDVLKYSPSAAPPEPQELIAMPDHVALLFRTDVTEALAAMGVAPAGEPGPDDEDA